MKYIQREISSIAELGKGKSKKPKKADSMVIHESNDYVAAKILIVTIPIRLECVTNKREHWRAVAERKRSQRLSVQFYLLYFAEWKTIEKRNTDRFPMTITITRLGLRKMDGDNLQTSAKYVRDGIADALGIDDGDESKVTWLYSQEIGKSYGCRVTIKMS